jgi:hypothetical protein
VPEPEPDRPIRPFAEALQQLAGGRTHTDLSTALNELVQAVVDTGKPGTLTFTLKIKPASHLATDAVAVTDSIAVKTPAPERQGSLFFVDRHSNLTRQNPQQPELPLRQVPTPAAPAADQLKDARP